MKCFKYTRLISLLAYTLFVSCNKASIDAELLPKTNANLKYFGYTLIDVGWDDPSDNENKTNYIDEVAHFSNIADILVVSPEDNIVSRMQKMNDLGVKSVLHVSELFFEIVGHGGNKSGVIYGLRDDYQIRWDSFMQTNELQLNDSVINCLYVGEEPAWNGISAVEFETACNFIKSTINSIPILNVEAFYTVGDIFTPNSVDIVGFDHYFIPSPGSSNTYLEEFNTLKSKMKSHQKVYVVMDAHWIKILHGSAGIGKNDMDFIARDYYNIANSDTMVIGVIGYFWPGGFDFKNALGTRNLPEHVKKEHELIGKKITGK